MRRFMNEPEMKQRLPERASAPVIYVVDDYAELGQMIEVFLRRAGYQTRVFSDPVLALAALEAAESKPRLLISDYRSEEHTSELQSRSDLVCRLLLEKQKRH